MARSARVAVVLAVMLALAGATPALGASTPGDGESTAVGPTTAERDGPTTVTTETTTETSTTTANGNETTTQSDEDERVVTKGFDPDYDPEGVLSRVESLRDLTATDEIVLHEYDDADGPETDLRDQFADVRPEGARALQLYSNASTDRRMPLGYAVERADGVHIHLMNASDLAKYDIAQEVVLAHEFVHALQFQHDLISPSREEFRTHFGEWTTDTQLVATAVVEGDAMWTTREYVDAYAGGGYSVGDYNRTLARPAWPHSIAGAPYYYGHEYYRASGGSPDERSAAIRRPPNSTAELLHPDASAGSGARAPLPAPPNSSQEFGELTTYHEDTVGELAIRHALRINDVSYADAAAAADGWANDRMYYATEQATSATHWVTVWDDETEAAEFAETWRGMLDARGAKTGANGTLVVPASDDAPSVHYVVERDGDTVRITTAPDAALAERFAQAGR
ncbi:hypothetical protein [Halorussus amylolyticus]|uniref:hypothetical protein n=1 Tax=Halorussus amylolyticus TaxID=1126242 RepID=UPI00104B4FF8|nr:hypothetical protein [Halorussus amylolyticus]